MSKDLFVLVTDEEEAYGNGFIVAGWDPDQGVAFYDDDGALELLAQLTLEGRAVTLYEAVPVKSLTPAQLRRLNHFLNEAEKCQEELSA